MTASNPAWIKACAKAIASVAYLPICEAVRAANRANSLTTPLPGPITEQHQVLAAWADQQATAALSVLTPLIEADVAERCAAIFAQKTEAEMEVDAAMNGDFEWRGLALAVRLIAGKIVSQKISAIRNAFPAKGEG